VFKRRGGNQDDFFPGKLALVTALGAGLGKVFATSRTRRGVRSEIVRLVNDDEVVFFRVADLCRLPL